MKAVPILKPPPLRPGALIGIVSPASPQRDDAFLQAGVRYLESLNYRVKIGAHAYNRSMGYLAGSDDERRADVEAMFADKSVSAIFCSRGGYGSARLLRSLDYRLIAANPKIFVGFSDITALQAAIYCETGLVTFSGALPAVDMRESFHPEAEAFFWRMLCDTAPGGQIEQSEAFTALYPGRATGRLVCGNLTMLAALCGSPWQPDYRDALFLTEEVGESPYRVDRALGQLENCGALGRLAGLALGQFTGTPQRADATPQPPLEDTLRDYIQRTAKPAIGNVLYGHQAKKLTLPYGIHAAIDGDKGELHLLESALSS